MDETIKIDRT